MADLLGVDKGMVCYWERNHRSPALRHVPRILEFLRYVPLASGSSLPERLRAYRYIQGLSQKKLARILGVDESTLYHWERGNRRPNEELLGRIQTLAAQC